MTPAFVALERQVAALSRQHRLAEAEALVLPHVASGTAPLPVWRLLVPILRRQGRIDGHAPDPGDARGDRAR